MITSVKQGGEGGSCSATFRASPGPAPLAAAGASGICSRSLSSCFCRDWAWEALLALAPNLATKASRRSICGTGERRQQPQPQPAASCSNSISHSKL
jgi:hypothetical protein